MDMRGDALKQARKAFAEDRDRVFLSMHVIFWVADYARHNGLAVLSKDGCFRDGQPHILDVMERRGHIEAPLKRYLMFGLDCASAGTAIDEMEEIMQNKCCASSYTGKEILIAYIYKLGIRGIQEGFGCNDLLNCFRSLVPDAEEDGFEAFSAKLLEDYSKRKRAPQSRKKNGLKLL